MSFKIWPLPVLLIFLTFSLTAQNQDEDAIFIKKLYDQELLYGKCYDWLKSLCNVAGPRLAGSDVYDRAVALTSEQMKSIPNVDVFLQQCTVKYWDRGVKETVMVLNPDGSQTDLHAFALGNSIGTGAQGIEAEVIEVKGLDDVDVLGRSKISGKIVFFNRPMDVTKIRTFEAYGGAVDQRVWGPSKAAEYGAVGVLVRSMTTKHDDLPHTGTLVYKENIPQISGMAISTNDADKLSALLTRQPVKIRMMNTSNVVGDHPTHSVIGEIRGSEFPDKIIVVGGHLDAWDVGQGAHDDGSGCVQSMDVLNTLVAAGYVPRHTIRAVLFANEENGLAGGTEYAKQANEKNEFHVAAIESDAGGFTPRGFSFDADTSKLKTYYKNASDRFLPLMESYGLSFDIGGSGSDIGPLKSQKGLLIGLRPDSQRYFDFHHTAADTFDAVNERELKLGSAAMSSLVYLIDKYGIE